MVEDAPLLPGLSPVGGKPVHVDFDGGRLTSDGGVLLLAEIEKTLGLAERLAGCIEDPRAPERVRHSLAEMIRLRTLMIAAGYADANDCEALRDDPAFKMAVGRLPETGAELCSQPTMPRLENLPTKTALKRMMDAMVELFCQSFTAVPRRIHPRAAARRARHPAALAAGGYRHPRRQPLCVARGHDLAEAQPRRLCLRPRRQSGGSPAHRRSRRGRGPRSRRGGRRQAPRFGEFRYAARSWKAERRVIARVEATRQGGDSRFIVTNLAGAPRWLYEDLYCGRGQAENLIKAHKLHLASDRTSCKRATPQPVPAAAPHRRLLAVAHLARSGSRNLGLV